MKPEQLERLYEADLESPTANDDLKALLAAYKARGVLIREVLEEKFDEADFIDWCARACAELGLSACDGCGKPTDDSSMCASCTVNEDLADDDTEATGA